MALVHKATITPTKLELLEAWLPSRPWALGATGFEQVGAYRFDDPEGEVGLEGILVHTNGGPDLHVPLTYRGAPLAGADEFLVGTMEHSTLGSRWVYDGCGDPVWVTALATTILTGGTQAELMVDSGDGGLERREPSATVLGSGSAGTAVPAAGQLTVRDEGGATVIEAGGLELAAVRRVGDRVSGTATLRGSWTEVGDALLAAISSAGSR